MVQVGLIDKLSTYTLSITWDRSVYYSIFCSFKSRSSRKQSSLVSKCSCSIMRHGIVQSSCSSLCECTYVLREPSAAWLPSFVDTLSSNTYSKCVTRTLLSCICSQEPVGTFQFSFVLTQFEVGNGITISTGVYRGTETIVTLNDGFHTVIDSVMQSCIQFQRFSTVICQIRFSVTCSGYKGLRNQW